MNTELKDMRDRIDKLETHLVDTNTALMELYQSVKSGELYRLTILGLMNKEIDVNSLK
jgi:hypothetical protein